MLSDNWKKSNYSAANGDCVELKLAGEQLVGVRDSKDPNGPSLKFSAAAHAAFIAAVNAGEFGDVASL